jgi:hypothetical protein
VVVSFHNYRPTGAYTSELLSLFAHPNLNIQATRGSTEFAASLSNAIGIVQLDKDKNLIHLHYIDGRDMNEPAADMHLQGRPYLSEIGNFQVTENVERFKGRNPVKGRPADPDKQAKIEFAQSTEGSLQDKSDAVNEKFGSNHSKSTVMGWLKGSSFDANQEDATP